MAKSKSKGDPSAPGETVRTLVSLAVCIHLICVFAALGANVERSRLQNALLEVLGPYTRTLMIDLDYTPYHLTGGTELDDDYFFEIAPDNRPNEAVTLPASANPVSDARERYQRLMYVMAFQARTENPAVALLTRAIADPIMKQHNWDEAVVRIVRHGSQPLMASESLTPLPDDPTDPSHRSTIYQAKVWRDDDGQLQLLKITDEGQAAPTVDHNEPADNERADDDAARGGP